MATILFLNEHSKRSYGYVLALKLAEEGHRPILHCRNSDAAATLKGNGIQTGAFDLNSKAARRTLQRCDAVVDTRLPTRAVFERMEDVRGAVFEEFAGTGRPFLATSSWLVLPDTRDKEASEKIRTRKADAPFEVDYERSIRRAPGLNSVIIRRAPEYSRFGFPEMLKPWLTLAVKTRRGAFVGSGTNLLSIAHFEEQVNLYHLALLRALRGDPLPIRVLHAATQTFSARDLAQMLHRSLRYKSEGAVSLTIDKARRYVPFAAALTMGSGMSSKLTRTLTGWEPRSRPLLERMEQNPEEWGLRPRIGAAAPPSPD